MEWFRPTIDIDGMVWGLATIGNNGFRWFSTIGPTMEWLPTIVEVYMHPISKTALSENIEYAWGRQFLWF